MDCITGVKLTFQGVYSGNRRGTIYVYMLALRILIYRMKGQKLVVPVDPTMAGYQSENAPKSTITQYHHHNGIVSSLDFLVHDAHIGHCRRVVLSSCTMRAYFAVLHRRPSHSALETIRSQE